MATQHPPGPPMTLGNVCGGLNEGFTKAPALAAFLIFCMSAVPSAAADEIPQVAFLGFQLINTSLEPTTTAEDRRIRTRDAPRGEVRNGSKAGITAALPNVRFTPECVAKLFSRLN
jgi:hypothetical protein